MRGGREEGRHKMRMGKCEAGYVRGARYLTLQLSNARECGIGLLLCV